MQVKLAKPQPTTNNNNNSELVVPGSGQSVHLQSAEPEYVPADDGSGSAMLCRWQFNVAGYQPTDINVKVDGGKLLLSARHADVKDADNTSSRQLSKQTDIPRDVVHEEMTSYMTRDGILVVQAPVARSRDNIAPRPSCPVTAPRSDVKTAAVNGDDAKQLECHFRPIELPPEQPPGDDVISASRRHVVKTGSITNIYC